MHEVTSQQNVENLTEQVKDDLLLEITPELIDIKEPSRQRIIDFINKTKPTKCRINITMPCEDLLSYSAVIINFYRNLTFSDGITLRLTGTSGKLEKFCTQLQKKLVNKKLDDLIKQIIMNCSIECILPNGKLFGKISGKINLVDKVYDLTSISLTKELPEQNVAMDASINQLSAAEESNHSAKEISAEKQNVWQRLRQLFRRFIQILQNVFKRNEQQSSFEQNVDTALTKQSLAVACEHIENIASDTPNLPDVAISQTQSTVQTMELKDEALHEEKNDYPRP